MLPDKFRVHGRDRYGEEFNSLEDDRETAEHVAAGVNRRGGRVEVERLVYSGPKAAWVSPEHHTVRAKCG